MAKTPKVRMAKPKGVPSQLRYTDPDTGREVRISTNTRDLEDAESQKEDLEAKLRLGIEAKPTKRSKGGLGMKWQDFRDRYSTQHLKHLRRRTRETTESRLNVIERILGLNTLGDLCDKEALVLLKGKLSDGAEATRPRSPHTVKTYIATAKATLSWAEENGWIDAVPKVKAVKTSKLKQMKGRPITLEEFERMLMMTERVVGPQAAASWRYLLRGAWESGLRLVEVMGVSWDDPTRITPEWPRGGSPILVIPAAMQKNDTEESIPLVPGFEKLLRETPENERQGWVFEPMSLQNRLGRSARHNRLSGEWVGKITTRIGKAAGVIVEPKKGKKPEKYASAHDLRRGFGDRMAETGIEIADLQAIMRHSSIETTRKYYMTTKVQRTAERIRKKLATVPRYNGELQTS